MEGGNGQPLPDEDDRVEVSAPPPKHMGVGKGSGKWGGRGGGGGSWEGGGGRVVGEGGGEGWVRGECGGEREQEAADRVNCVLLFLFH